MRTIKKIHTAMHADMGHLLTYRAMPTHSIDHIDPFLFLNHHGPQKFAPNNPGLPFGPHPHRGFETLTFVVQGSLVHQDSTGINSNILTGGIQWMTAGKGIVHSELASDTFKKEGGMEELIQLWLNLPAKHKGVAPSYIGLQKEELPVHMEDDNRVAITLISGEWRSKKGPIEPLSNIEMSFIELKEGGSFEVDIPEAHAILFYVVRGNLSVNGHEANMYQLVAFEHEGEKIIVKAKEDSMLILGHALPFNEPIVAYGPFVMNSEDEIRQAYADYQAGKFV